MTRILVKDTFLVLSILAYVSALLLAALLPPRNLNLHPEEMLHSLVGMHVSYQMSHSGTAGNKEVDGNFDDEVLR